MVTHERTPENGYNYQCPMQEFGKEKYVKGEQMLACGIYFKTEWQRDNHIALFHTDEAINARKQSEDKMACFFDTEKIEYDRDWQNHVRLCMNPKGKKSARPDFRLTEHVTNIVIVSNDEGQHRTYKCRDDGNRFNCDYKRMFDVYSNVCRNKGQGNIQWVWIRFNPHFYFKGDDLRNPGLEERHRQLGDLQEKIKNDHSMKEKFKPGELNIIYMFFDTDNEGILECWKGIDKLYRGIYPENVFSYDKGKLFLHRESDGKHSLSER